MSPTKRWLACVGVAAIAFVVAPSSARAQDEERAGGEEGAPGFDREEWERREEAPEGRSRRRRRAALSAEPASGAGGEALQEYSPPGAAGAPERPSARLSEGIVEDPERVVAVIERSRDTVPVATVVEEMIEELVTDLRAVPLDQISPIAIRRVRASTQIAGWFADHVQATSIAGITAQTDIDVKRCVACDALRSRVDGDEWVVTLGIANPEELRAEAERLGVRTFLDLRVAYYPAENTITLVAEAFDPEDGAIVFSESYRSDATTAAVLRSGERFVSREERVAELERKLEARPYYGHQVVAGAGYIPYDGPEGGIGGIMFGYRLYERFGDERRYSFAIGAEGFANFSDNALLGAFIGAQLQYEVFAPNLNLPIFRTGPELMGFFAGSEGNSFAAAWGADLILQFRLGIGLSAFYFLPVTFAGADLGGLGIKARVSFNW